MDVCYIVEVEQIKNISEPIQNELCYGCKFCLWDNEYKRYVCVIRGCFDNSKYVEFLIGWRETNND